MMKNIQHKLHRFQSDRPRSANLLLADADASKSCSQFQIKPANRSFDSKPKEIWIDQIWNLPLPSPPGAKPPTPRKKAADSSTNNSKPDSNVVSHVFDASRQFALSRGLISRSRPQLLRADRRASRGPPSCTSSERRRRRRRRRLMRSVEMLEHLELDFEQGNKSYAQKANAYTQTADCSDEDFTLPSEAEYPLIPTNEIRKSLMANRSTSPDAEQLAEEAALWDEVRAATEAQTSGDSAFASCGSGALEALGQLEESEQALAGRESEGTLCVTETVTEDQRASVTSSITSSEGVGSACSRQLKADVQHTEVQAGPGAVQLLNLPGLASRRVSRLEEEPTYIEIGQIISKLVA